MRNGPQACLVLWALIPCSLVSVRSLLCHSPCRVPWPFPTHLPIHQERHSLLVFLPLSSCQKVGLSFGSFTCHCTLPRPQESWCHFSEGTSGMMKVHVLQFRGLSSSQNLGMFFRPGCPTWTSFPFQSSSVLTTVFLWERSKVFTSPTSSSAFAATSEVMVQSFDTSSLMAQSFNTLSFFDVFSFVSLPFPPLNPKDSTCVGWTQGIAGSSSSRLVLALFR
mmetsp:Transcript_22755/g.38116  ORF Transcript_22755/g.38116 Transcript_22755/m.38116 type:complete len:221 (+) Transcript_22755:637-1299(+)